MILTGKEGWDCSLLLLSAELDPERIGLELLLLPFYNHMERA